MQKPANVKKTVIEAERLLLAALCQQTLTPLARNSSNICPAPQIHPPEHQIIFRAISNFLQKSRDHARSPSQCLTAMGFPDHGH